MSERACTVCGAPVRNQPNARYCRNPDCQRVRWRETNALRGKPRPPRPCAQCGRPIPPDRPSRVITCSEQCALDRRRAIGRSHYQRLVAAVPGYNSARYAALRARAQHDPELAERLGQMERRRQLRQQERYRSDPEYRERLLAYHRALYGAHANEVLARRREILASLPAEMREERHAAGRRNSRSYRRRWREALRSEPGRHAQYLNALRSYRIARARLRALTQLAEVGEELGRRLTDGAE